MNVKALFQLAIAGLVLLAVTIPTIAGHRHKPSCPKCGCTEIEFIEVTKQQCRMVTEKVPIKKTVYETKQVPHCGHPVASHHGKCPTCSCTRMKSVLVKKEVKCGEKAERKCVVEDVKVLVPVCCSRCGCKELGSLHAESSSTEDSEPFAGATIIEQTESIGTGQASRVPTAPESTTSIRLTDLPNLDDSVVR